MSGTRTAVIAGVGESPLTASGSGRAPDSMTVEAALAACEDAGLSPRVVDGAVKYSYDAAIGTFALLASIGAQDMHCSLDVPFGGGSCAAVIDVARGMIEAGRADAVLCWRTVSGDDWIRQLSTADPLRPYYRETVDYLRPVGWTGYIGIFAGFYAEYLASGEMPREAMLETVNLMRHNAALNRHAVATEPVSADEYFGAPRTVGPFTPYDEFALADASCAVLVTEASLAGARSPAVEIAASAQSHGPRPKVYFDSRSTTSNDDSPAAWVARALYREAGIAADQIDVGMIYDCLSFTLLYLAEHYGLCPRGESAEWVTAGAFGSEGQMPINPHGGDLAAGYTHGFGQILEAVRQLRGGADNQIPGVGTVLVGGPPAGPTSGLILRREDV